MSRLFSLLFLSISLSAGAQLGPSITLPGCPAGGDSIAYMPTYIDTTLLYMNSGYQAGQIAGDFTLCDENGTAYTLSNEIASGHPALLIAGNYTCPYFREGMTNRLPQIVSQYGQQLKIFVIYCLEAHPDSPYVSPYRGQIWTTSQNTAEGILYPQHQTYNDRKQMAHIADSALSISVPVLIDQPGNPWLTTYGPASHNVYLVLPDGYVYSKYGWFHDEHNMLLIDIDNLLLTLDVKNNSSEISASIYPNPLEAGSVLQVKGLDEYSLKIFDLAGRCVAEKNSITQEAFALPAHGLSAGTYICAIGDKHGAVRLHRKFTVR